VNTAGNGWRELPRGAAILKAGNAREYHTGDWRSDRPIWDKDKCINCLFCWVYCPDAAIMVKDGKMTGIDYDHCKGCGICAAECPKRVEAITMIKESEAAAAEKQNQGGGS
jgi:2-oxoacid:acceptor oxidoreductase delta subunit (pyruvate/2-ketoisovalerate family)